MTREVYFFPRGASFPFLLQSQSVLSFFSLIPTCLSVSPHFSLSLISHWSNDSGRAAGSVGENRGELLCWLIKTEVSMEGETNIGSVAKLLSPRSFHWRWGLVTETGTAVWSGPFLRSPNLLVNVIF